jgi:hypothetical protein
VATQPVLPFSTISNKAPVSQATTGLPATIASVVTGSNLQVFHLYPRAQIVQQVITTVECTACYDKPYSFYSI